MRSDFKKTTHTYKGFVIHGGQVRSSGGYVLGGRYFIEGGIKRNYSITIDGKHIFSPGTIISKLKDAKEEIDEYLIRKNITE